MYDHTFSVGLTSENIADHSIVVTLFSSFHAAQFAAMFRIIVFLQHPTYSIRTIKLFSKFQQAFLVDDAHLNACTSQQTVQSVER